jgi:hypothetical protein
MDTAGQSAQPEGYSGSAEVAAGIAAFFFPVISLIVALLLMSGQQSERKRAQLRTWAWISAGWIAVQVVFVLLFVVAWSSGGGSDVGPVTTMP